MSDEIVLYQYGGMGPLPSLSPPCLKVFLALKLIGAPHRVENLGSPREVACASPTKRVPAIEYQGLRIAESIRVMDRLEELFPDAGLWAPDEAGRVQQRLWDCFVTDTLYWLGFYQRWLVPKTREQLLDTFLGEGFSVKKLAMRIYAKTTLRKRAEGQGVGLRPAGEVREAYLSALDMIVAGIGAGPFLGGSDRPGRGDCALAGHLSQLTFKRDLPQVQSVLADRQAIERHVAAVFEAAGLEVP